MAKRTATIQHHRQRKKGGGQTSSTGAAAETAVVIVESAVAEDGGGPGFVQTVAVEAHSSQRPPPPPPVKPDRCGALLTSCFGPKTCRLCCQWCPSTKESTSTKLIYVMTLFMGSGLMSAMLIPDVQRSLQTVFRDFNATCIDLNIGPNCMKLTGYMAVYKISFSVTFYFAAMALVTLGVTSSKGVRAYIHNGFWFFKLLAVVTVIVATFVIPISHLSELHSGWIYTTQVGNLLFMVLQTLCLIDITGCVCKALDKMASCSRVWRSVQVASAIMVLGMWVVMAIVIFISHGRQEFCVTKHLIILLNTGFCISMVLTAITPCARSPGAAGNHAAVASGGGGIQGSSYGARLLQSGLMAVYVTFWVWSAMQSTPETPGFIEVATRLIDSDTATCRHYNSKLSERSMLAVACFTMVITVAYVISDSSGVKARVFGAGVVNMNKGLGSAGGSSDINPASNSFMMTSSTAHIVTESESEPKFCVCLQVYSYIQI